MAYFAWHKLAPRKLISLFTPGCTAVCCCPPECPGGGVEPTSGDPFVVCEPYPVDFPDSFCCVVETGNNTWCPPIRYSGGAAPGVCYGSNPRNLIFGCTTWVGTIDENGQITWVYNGLNTINCSGESAACQNTTPGPLTSRITVGNDSNGGTAAFLVQRENLNGYNQMRFADPAFAWESPPKYYRTPIQPSSEPDVIYETPMCLRLRIHQNVPTRTMVLSGYNKYRYTGYLTNDPAVNTINYTIPKIVDSPGASGLSQMEGSLGRVFPASDDVLTFPLWGANDSYMGNDLENCGTNNCFGSVIEDIGGTATGFCVGDDCLKVQTNSTTGHYLSMVTANLTGHYHSFSGFNPYVKFWEATDSYAGADDTGNDSAYSNGTGLPTCSLFSLAWALYDRSWRAIAQYSSYTTESALVGQYSATFGDVRSILSSLLGDDPRNLTGSHGESVVSYWFRELNEKIKTFHNAVNAAESLSLPVLGDPLYEYGAFTIPNVILWDRTAFLNASTNADRWKSLYIPGSGNILFDSGCTQTNDTWRAYKFILDEATHDMAWGSTHAARIVQFRVCDASQDQVLSNTCISLEAVPQVVNSDFCSVCATSGSPFNMGDEHCITGPRPEIWGDTTVGTDYTP